MKSKKYMSGSMKYRKGGMKKAQASIDLLPENTAEEKTKKAKLLRERELSRQRRGLLKPIDRSVKDMDDDERSMMLGSRGGLGVKRGMLEDMGGMQRVENREAKLPKRKPVPPAKKSTAGYEEAKSKDPKLNEYIKARNKAKKGSAAYIAAQNKINAAYDRGPQRDVKKGTMEAAEKKGVSKISSGVKQPTLQMRSAPSTPSTPAASTSKAKAKAKTKVKAKPAKESIVEPSKEIKFEGPSKRADRMEKRADRINKRKDKREAVKSAKEKLRAARRR